MPLKKLSSLDLWSRRVLRFGGLWRNIVRGSLRVIRNEFAAYGAQWAGQGTGAPLARVDPFGSYPNRFATPMTVIDIGGSHGQFVSEALRAFPAAKIYSFEPLPECFEELQQIARQHPALHPRQLALSDAAGFDDFNVSSFSDSSSFQRMLPKHLEAWPHTATKECIRVEKARLDDQFDPVELARPIFIKIDVQGHELQVIRGGRQVLAASQRVMIECNFANLYDGQPGFDELHREMRELGFLLDCLISPLRHPVTGELMSSDLIYFRPLSDRKDP